MLFSLNWTKELLKGKFLKVEEIVKALNLHTVEVEELIKTKKDYLLDLDILPNRASDLASHLGLAKELKVLFPSLKLKPLKTLKIQKKANFKIEVENSEDCPLYLALIVRNVKVKESPSWVKEKLVSLGLEPINNLVDLANLVMLEIGQPLHVFDLDKIEEKIIVRRAKKGERILALDDKEYLLSPEILVIADKKKAQAIAGIKGGKLSAVSKETKNILVESANFNPALIRKGSKILNLKTDASWRFERKVPKVLAKLALERFAFLLGLEIKDIEIEGIVEKSFAKFKPKTLWFDLNSVYQILDLNLPKREIEKILKRLEFKILQKKKDKLWLQVPDLREDIKIEEDVVEEIGRVVGFYQIKPAFPKLSLKVPANLNFSFEKALKERLIALGFTEVLNYSFLAQRLKEIFKIDSKSLIELENPLSSNQKYLRDSLLYNLIQKATDNSKYFKEGKLFETGKVFFKVKDKPFEEERLALVWFGKNLNFYEFKGYLEFLAESFGIKEVEFLPKENIINSSQSINSSTT